MSMTPEEKSEFLQIYLDETEEELDALVDTLLVLEEDPESKEHLNEAFRMVHSVKGAAGMMGFDDITALTHELESRFEKLRSGLLKLDQPTMSIALRSVDYLRECNEQIRSGEKCPDPDELLHELRTLDISQATPVKDFEEASEDPSLDQGSTDSSIAGQPVSEAAPPTQESATSPASDSESIADQTDAGSDPRVDVVATRPGREFSSLETTYYEVNVSFEPALKLLDMKGQLVIARVSEVAEVISTYPSVEELATLTGPVQFGLLVSTHRNADELSDAADVHGVTEITVSEREDREFASLEEAAEEPIAAEDLTGVAASGESGPEVDNARQPETGTSSRSSEPKGKVAETVRVEIDRLDNLLNLAGELVVNKARFAQIATQMSPVFRQSSFSGRGREFSERMRRAINGMKASSELNGHKDWAQQLGDLEDELAGLEQQAAQWDESRRCLGQIHEAIDQLTRVSDSLQRGVLQTRMVPVAPLFNRFKRVVRDLAADRNKKISLRISGEKTELDKRMIDELGDPLVHLVRNSIDHGMELPEQRANVGKPEAGTVSLEASHSGNNVFIRVRDDGRGINVQRVRDRIVDRQILTSAGASQLSDEQIIEYIWHPGFSTAETVTNISGRGVGMDIVKTRITELNGSVEVESTAGEGTTFTIRLPLTLAIINGLLFRIGHVTYSAPIEDAHEIVSISPHQVVSVHGKQTLDVHGQFIPLVSIDELFSWHGVQYGYEDYDPPDAAIVNVLVLQSGGRAIGLRVDELLGGEDIVIKSLSENFVNIRGLSGASILGDGTVSLLLDVGTMMNMAAEPKR